MNALSLDHPWAADTLLLASTGRGSRASLVRR